VNHTNRALQLDAPCASSSSSHYFPFHLHLNQLKNLLWKIVSIDIRIKYFYKVIKVHVILNAFLISITNIFQLFRSCVIDGIKRVIKETH
jgi:hypothetical protein